MERPSCWRRATEARWRALDEVDARSIAFPAISTGVYGYPIEPAAAIAVETIRAAITSVELVRFVAFNEETIDAYRPLLHPG